MSDLRAKLAALGHRRATEPQEDAAAGDPAAEVAEAAEVLGAQVQEGPSGSVLVRTVRIPVGASWGSGVIRTPEYGPVLRGYVGDGLGRLRHPERTVYVDTETTGLTGGSGTYAFLVGIGRFHQDAFVLRQLFLRGPWAERALLETASLLLEGAEAVVSYNGKSFDVPLLRGRLAYHGMPDPLRRTPQVDLLHIARRLWRERLPACGLGDVERGALGVGRGAQDVPGHLIPELYFEFLRSGRAEPLRGVMHHNELDVCSLAALLVHVDDLLEGRCDPAALPLEDLVSLARTREALGDAADALALLETATGRTKDMLRAADALAADAYLRAGRLAKRLQRHEHAKRHFRNAADVPTDEGAHVEAAIELAKLFEHHERDWAAALACVDAGIGALTTVVDRLRRERLGADLSYRRARLLRKLSGAQEASRAARQSPSS